ncbi:class I SAM-dependent methyltransferase [Anaerolineales bacterium HSG6]|nr:class I SAM-dependent methyltransferase [Anaerolineales bacterium HSG6]MDM8531516.1 class I SAM-dependent methyltransferase [Anaerolineales bacterium HSG25]
MNQSWLDQETARHYQIFTEQTRMYQELSQIMIDLAQLQPSMQVLDLGCGTGVTSQLALKQLGSTGQIQALDISEPMLEIARQNISSSQVTFLHVDVTQCADYIKKPVDRILCNSVFWQFRHKSQLLHHLRKIIAQDGRFIFNVPEPYFIFRDVPRSDKVGILFKQLAAERHGVGQQDQRTMAVFLEQHGFEIVTTKEVTRTRTTQENMLFLQIPVTTAWMEPPLDYKTRMTLLAEAEQMAKPDKPAKRRWIYFVVQPIAIP